MKTVCQPLLVECGQCVDQREAINALSMRNAVVHGFQRNKMYCTPLKFILLLKGGENMNVNDWYNGRYYFIKLNGLSMNEILILWRFIRKIDQTFGCRYWALTDTEVRFSENLFYASLALKIEFMHIVGIIEERMERQSMKQAVEEDLLQKQKKHFDSIEI